MKTARLVLILALAIALGWAIHTLPVSADAHVPRIAARAALTGQTADATVATENVPGGGADYLVTLVPVLTAGTGNAGQVHIDYTDDLGAQTYSIALIRKAASGRAKGKAFYDRPHPHSRNRAHARGMLGETSGSILP